MDLRRLSLLRDLHSLGTVAAVADKNGISSSAVSQQIRALEAESSVTLLVRERKRLRFTSAGEFYIEKINRVLNALEDAQSALEGLAESITGPFRVASATGLVAAIGGGLVRSLKESWPQVDFELAEMQSEDVEAALLRHEADLALVLEYGTAVDDDEFSSAVAVHPIHLEHFVMLVPERLADDARERGLAALQDEQWCLNAPQLACSRTILAVARRHGFTPNIRYQGISYANAARLVGEHVGVAVVPELSFQTVPEGVVAIRSEVPPRTISAVTRGGGASHPVTADALRVLREVTASLLTVRP